MKKHIALILSIILIFILAACGSGEGNVLGAEQKPDPGSPYASYLGEYRCVSLISSTNGDLTSIIEKGWADKSFYMYVAISETNGRWDFMICTVNKGETTVDSLFLDPERSLVSPDPEFKQSAGSPVVFGDDGTITIESKSQKSVFIKTNDIPH